MRKTARWMGVGGRFINLNYVRSIQIEAKQQQWELVATCATEEQAFGYVVFLLKDDLVNAEGGHPSLRSGAQALE